MKSRLRRIDNPDSVMHGLYRAETPRAPQGTTLRRIEGAPDRHAAAHAPVYEDADGHFRAYRVRRRSAANPAEWHIAAKAGEGWRFVHRETSRRGCEEWVAATAGNSRTGQGRRS